MPLAGTPAKLYIPSMILGTGIDVVSVPRFRGFLERTGDRGLRRLFTAAEREYCLRHADAVPSLAARFAAKEAFFKAAGTGWSRGGAWADVEVTRPRDGRPELALHRRAAEALLRLGASGAHLSLSHTEDLAVAQVILEG